MNSPQPGSYPECGHVGLTLLTTNPSSLGLPESWFWPLACLADRHQNKLSHVNNFLMDFCVLLIAAINLAKLKLFRHYYVMVSKTPAHMHVGNLEAVQSFWWNICWKLLQLVDVVEALGTAVLWHLDQPAYNPKSNFLFSPNGSILLSLFKFQLFVMLPDFLWRQLELPVELMGLNNVL